MKHIKYLLFIFLLVSCVSLPPHNPVPEATKKIARIEGYPASIRYWGDEKPVNLKEIITEKYKQSNAYLKSKNQKQSTISYLALSGGGNDGAYGAGLLYGWSKTGKRPEFDLVTGVSTGALMAPFAFLGSKYDKKLKKMYTTMSSDNIFRASFGKIVKGLTGGTALTDTKPLRKQLKKYISKKVFDGIAREHKKGRRLLISTTNLDAQRPVIWDIGAIANSGNPDALDFIRKIILASASIPAAFPPVFFKVTSDDENYTEMHVDGGVTSQVFLYPTALSIKEIQGLDIPKYKRNLYIIRNTKIAPEYSKVKPRLIYISGRAVQSLIKYQGIGDLYRIYMVAERDGLDYNLAYIPEEFNEKSDEIFDPKYMSALFKLGYEQAKNGYEWEKAPPVFSNKN